MYPYKVCYVTSRHLLSTVLGISVNLTSTSPAPASTQVNICLLNDSF